MNKNKITLALVGALIGICGIAGHISLKDISISEFEPQISPVSCAFMGEAEAKRIQDKIPVHLYYATKDNKLKLVVRYVTVEEAQKDIGNFATIIMEELIREPKEKELRGVIPKGTKLEKPVQVKNNIAIVDLSEEFVKNHKGGIEEEKLTIFSIVNSMTELKDINKVRFKVNGKTLKDYKGNFRFDKDFKRFKSETPGITPTNTM
ncbi:MAG: GerMN domain-containing protein [Clostridiales bacterium]|nr:GerMN domain-containing protein [Clostridiales bacterium]